MRRSEEGGYDTWGVVLPDGKVREFSTAHNAATFAERMEGKTILGRNHEPITWTGLTVVHRYIPTWSPVANVDELLKDLGTRDA